jgi:hypothetical protein
METIHDPLPPDHDVIVQHFYKARCSCGWVGPERYQAEDGGRDLDGHFKFQNDHDLESENASS